MGEPCPDDIDVDTESDTDHEAAPAPVSVLDVVTGAGVVVTVCVSLATSGGARLAKGVAQSLPLPRLPSLRRPGGRLDSLGALGREQRHALELAGSRLLDRLVPKAVDATLQRVDIEKVISMVDIDGIAARLDLEAVIGRLDLVALTEEILNAIDIPEVIRESTTAVASEGVREVRMQSITADEAVARVLDRIRLRRRRHHDLGPAAIDEIVIVTTTAAAPSTNGTTAASSTNGSTPTPPTNGSGPALESVVLPDLSTPEQAPGLTPRP